MNHTKSLVFFALLICASISGQVTITGTVTNTDGEVLLGANVSEEGTNSGVITDFDGNYLIKVSSSDVVLIFSYVGFETQKVSVIGDTVVDVVLKEEEEALDQVVVIGYGTARKSQITSSIASVQGEEITKFAASNPIQSLQGKVSGVQVISTGGNPGAAPKILIRGVTSNLPSDPLIVLDGVPLPEGTSLNFLNPDDIKDFQILKDATASAIYGSRAANGVILVTTKRGKVGKVTINADASYGVQVLEKFDLAGSAEYIEVINRRRTNDGLSPLFPNPDQIVTDTDWWDETIEDFAPVTQVNVSASGGTEKMKYSASIGYFNQDSYYSKGWYEKATVRSNMDFNITDRLTLRQDFNLRFEEFEDTPVELFNIFRIDPTTDVFLPIAARRDRNIFSIYAPSINTVPNPVATINRNFGGSYIFNSFTNTQLSYKFTSDIKFTSQFGINAAQLRRDVFLPEFFISSTEQRGINEVSRQINENLDYVWNNTITFEKQSEDHYLNITGGVVWDRQRFNFLRASRDNIPENDNPDLRYLDAATGENVEVSGNETRENILSGFFRSLYNYKNKYYLSSTVRVDQSSKFRKENRIGIFPSISLAWDVDSESFFNVGFIDNLRLKAGYGEIGNQNIDENSRFSIVQDGNFVFGGGRVITNAITQIGNPDLTWETVIDKNAGIQTTFFNSFDLSVEYYDKTSENLLFNVQAPIFTGIPIPGTIAQNVGSFKSTGWDVSLGYRKKINNLSLDINLNVATNESIAEELAVGNGQLFGQTRAEFGNRSIKITEEGRPIGLFYGFKTSGIFQNQTEINSHTSESGVPIQPNAQVGDLRFEDVNGDGILNDNDLTSIGNPFPDFFGGLVANISYKNWDFSMQWYGTYGNEVFNFNRTYINSGIQDVNIRQGAINNVWTPDNTSAEFPRLSFLDLNGNYQRPSNLFVEDASYLRLRSVQLGYSFRWNSSHSCRVFVSGQNLLTFTDYSGLDPEVQSQTGSIVNDFGVDLAQNPIARTIILGINLTL